MENRAFDWNIQVIRSIITLFLEFKSTITLQFPIKNIKILEFSKSDIGIPMESVKLCRNLKSINVMITAEDIKRMAERGESYNVDFKVT